MRKSCLVQLILLIIIVGVSSLAIKHALDPARRAGAATPTAEATSLTEAVLPAEQHEATPSPAVLVAIPALDLLQATPQEEDLMLVGSRPVMLAEGYPVGLAATADWLYLACRQQDGAAGSAPLVARISLHDYEVADAVELASARDAVPGGMAVGPDAVWLALRDSTAEGVGMLLALDPITLAMVRTVTVAAPVVAVAVSPAGELYASRCQPGELLHLSSAGEPLAQVAGPEGVCYTDLEFIQGHLVGVATLRGVGVLDVLAPDDLTLVARHTLALTSARGNPVAGNAFASDGERFFFAPDRTPNPIIMAYQPRDGDLSRLIPVALPW